MYFFQQFCDYKKLFRYIEKLGKKWVHLKCDIEYIYTCCTISLRSNSAGAISWITDISVQTPAEIQGEQTQVYSQFVSFSTEQRKVPVSSEPGVGITQ